MNDLPRWFIQTQDGVLHAYWDRSILLIDISRNKGEPVTILQLRRGIRDLYAPITEAEMRQEEPA